MPLMMLRLSAGARDLAFQLLLSGKQHPQNTPLDLHQIAAAISAARFLVSCPAADGAS
jgi:hypothetical protein